MTSFHDHPLGASLDAFVADLHRIESPKADDALLARVLESRAAGVCITLPDGAPGAPKRDVRRVRWIGGAAFAAAVLLVATSFWSARRTGSGSATTSAIAARTDEATSRIDSSSAPETSPASAFARLVSPWPQIAYAQSPGVAREPAYAPVVVNNTSRLVAARRTYVRSMGSDYHSLLPSEVFELETSRSVYRGVPAWVVVTRKPGRAVPDPDDRDTRGFDTLWLRADNLRPIERRDHIGTLFTNSTLFSATEVKQSYQVDSAFQRRFDEEQARLRLLRPHTRSTRPPSALTQQRTAAQLDSIRQRKFSSPIDSTRILVSTEAAMRLLLRAIPLSIGWKGSVGVLFGQSGTLIGARQYLNLRVVGVDTVQTYRGRFPCWRVLLDLGTNPGIWHVSQETGETLLNEGPYGKSYRESETRLVHGFEETRQAPRLKFR